MRAFVNADIYAPEAVYPDHALLVRDQIIQSIVPRRKVPRGFEIVDLQGRNVTAGFVDLQVNGGGGYFFNIDRSPRSVLGVLEAHRRLGTTSIFPTIFTSSSDAMEELLHTVVDLRAHGTRGLAGIHFEGPVIQAGKAGVHDLKNIVPLDDQLVHFFQKAAGLLPTLVTLAPERVTDDQIAALRAAGVLLLAGHTEADYARMKSAFTAGLQGGTHLFNAMSPFGSREPGTVGALLAEDSAFASIIVDGQHVHWASVRAAWNAKKSGTLFCVTDAMPCVGSSLAEFQIGHLHVQVRNGRCETDDGVLAGSALDMATAVRNLVQKVGIPLPESLRMANSYPTKFAHLDGIGIIAPRERADFVVFDNEVRISAVYVGGEPLFQPNK